MKSLNERYNYGLDLILLSVDEGITGYRDDSLEVLLLENWGLGPVLLNDQHKETETKCINSNKIYCILIKMKIISIILMLLSHNLNRWRPT